MDGRRLYSRSFAGVTVYCAAAASKAVCGRLHGCAHFSRVMYCIAAAHNGHFFYDIGGTRWRA
eukprot:3929295-Pleurochrysis_carterae.AAC.1